MVCSRVAPDSATVATGVKQSPKIHITQIPSHYIHNALTQMRALNLLLHNRTRPPTRTQDMPFASVCTYSTSIAWDTFPLRGVLL